MIDQTRTSTNWEIEEETNSAKNKKKKEQKEMRRMDIWINLLKIVQRPT